MRLGWCCMAGVLLAACADPAGGTLEPLDPGPAPARGEQATPAAAPPGGAAAAQPAPLAASPAGDGAALTAPSGEPAAAPVAAGPAGPTTIRLQLGVELGIDATTIIPGESPTTMRAVAATTEPFGFMGVALLLDGARVKVKEVELVVEEDVPQPAVAALVTLLKGRGITVTKTTRVAPTVQRPPVPYLAPPPTGPGSTLPRSRLKAPPAPK